MGGSGQSGDGEVVDLAAFRRHSEGRKLKEILAPEVQPAAEKNEPEPEPAGGLVVEVGRDVWPGTAPLDVFMAKVDQRDHALLAECRTAALAGSPGPPDPDDVTDGVAVLQRFLARLGDDGLPLAGEGGIAESSIVSALMGDGYIGMWKGQGLGSPARHPARRVRTAATALRLVRRQGRTLVVTRRGAALRESPEALWNHVVASLPLDRTPGGTEAGLLVLLLTAAGRATPDREFARTVNGVGQRLRLNSPDPDFSPRETVREAPCTIDVLNWAGRARAARLELPPPVFPSWAALNLGPAIHLARAALAGLT